MVGFGMVKLAISSKSELSMKPKTRLHTQKNSLVIDQLKKIKTVSRDLVKLRTFVQQSDHDFLLP